MIQRPLSMLLGVIAKDGQLHRLAPGTAGPGEAFPGHFNFHDLTLDWCEERFQLKHAGRGGWNVEYKPKGWGAVSSAAQTFGLGGDCFVCPEGIFLIAGSLDSLRLPATVGGAVKRAFVAPMVRTFCFIRAHEIRGWTSRRRGRTRLYCLLDDETWLVPAERAIVNLPEGDPVLRDYVAKRLPETADVRALDRAERAGVPLAANSRDELLLFVLPVAIGLLGGPLLIAATWRASGGIQVIGPLTGVALMIGGPIAAIIGWIVVARRQRRANARSERETRRRGLEHLARNAFPLAEQFAAKAARSGVHLDFGLATIPALDGFVAALRDPRPLQPTANRLAAYLGEVVSRDLSPHAQSKWNVDDDGAPVLGFPGLGMAVDVLPFAESALGLSPKQSPGGFLVEARTHILGIIAAQPFALFEAIGLGEVGRERGEAILRLQRTMPAEGVRVTPNPFTAVQIRKRWLAEELCLQHIVMERPREGPMGDELRSFRPVIEPRAVRGVVVHEVTPLHSQVEAVAALELAVQNGSPIGCIALVTNWAQIRPEAMAGGTVAKAAVGAIAGFGEILDPVTGANGAAPGFGSLAPADRDAVNEPYARITGIVERPRGGRVEGLEFPLWFFDVNVRGIRIPLVIAQPQLRGQPVPGHAFQGVAWIQAQLYAASRGGADPSVQ